MRLGCRAIALEARHANCRYPLPRRLSKRPAPQSRLDNSAYILGKAPHSAPKLVDPYRWRGVFNVVAVLASAILLLPLVRGHLSGVTILLVSWGLAFGAMPVSLQLWVFKAAPEALEGGAALLVSTFQIFIALGSVLGGRVVDSFGTSAVMFGGGGTALVGLILVRLSRHSSKHAVLPSRQGSELDCPCVNKT